MVVSVAAKAYRASSARLRARTRWRTRVCRRGNRLLVAPTTLCVLCISAVSGSVSVVPSLPSRHRLELHNTIVLAIGDEDAAARVDGDPRGQGQRGGVAAPPGPHPPHRPPPPQ